MIEQDSRRASPRVKCRWAVRCVTEDKKTFDTRAVNISQGGISVITPVPFKNGDRLYLEIAGYMNATQHLIKVVGSVAYFSVSSGDGMQIGLQFISALNITDSKFLQQFVKNSLGG